MNFSMFTAISCLTFGVSAYAQSAQPSLEIENEINRSPGVPDGATPNNNFGFFEWFNISLFSLWANPNYIWVGNDLVNTLPNFQAAPILTVAANAPLFPSIGTLPSVAGKVDGNYLNTPQNFTWTASRALDGTPQTASPVTTNLSYAFAYWSDSGAQAHSVAPAGINKIITANYTPTYRAIVFTNPICGNNTVTPNGDSNLLNGTQVTYKTNAGAGYTFVGWSGGFSGTTNPLPTTVNDQIRQFQHHGHISSPDNPSGSLTEAMPTPATSRAIIRLLVTSRFRSAAWPAISSSSATGSERAPREPASSATDSGSWTLMACTTRIRFSPMAASPGIRQYRAGGK